MNTKDKNRGTFRKLFFKKYVGKSIGTEPGYCILVLNREVKYPSILRIGICKLIPLIQLFLNVNLDYLGIKIKKMAQFGLNWSHLDVCEHDRTLFKSFISRYR